MNCKDQCIKYWKRETQSNMIDFTCSCGDCDPEEVFPCGQGYLMFICHDEYENHKFL